MTLTDTLRRARALLERGCALPPALQCFDGFDRDGRGAFKSSYREDDDGPNMILTVEGALNVAGGGEWLAEATMLLERVVAPAYRAERDFYAALPPDAASRDWWAAQPELTRRGLLLMQTAARGPYGLTGWLEQPGRTLADVLRALGVAILRSQPENTR